ncbi:hypothetical protein V1502_15650 [Bacillus sp. SCS-153A]|uniref:hypothetical protein n=1 Tax=Rossellomorea sedimentorum TaxID=3115294 RepID=UPI003905FDD0
MEKPKMMYLAREARVMKVEKTKNEVPRYESGPQKVQSALLLPAMQSAVKIKQLTGVATQHEPLPALTYPPPSGVQYKLNIKFLSSSIRKIYNSKKRMNIHSVSFDPSVPLSGQNTFISRECIGGAKL